MESTEQLDQDQNLPCDCGHPRHPDALYCPHCGKSKIRPWKSIYTSSLVTLACWLASTTGLLLPVAHAKEPPVEGNPPLGPSNEPSVGPTTLPSATASHTAKKNHGGLPVPPGTSVITSPPVESSGELLKPDSTSASSYFEYKTERHPAAHAFDGNPATAWNEAHGGAGVGSWIEAEFAQPRLVRSITISTGYNAISPKYGDLFVLNRHAKTIKVIIDGNTNRSISVAQDQRQVTLENLNIAVKTLRFVIDEIWNGTRWQDMCISEIAIRGDAAPSTAPRRSDKSDQSLSSAGVNPTAAAPSGMVAVPAGSFLMGSDQGKGSEQPQRTITLTKPFFIDKTEVTAGQYQACVDSGTCTPTSIHGPAAGAKAITELSFHCTGGDAARADHPINCIDLAQAVTYCKSVGKRLPTEAEWEYAARGPDGRSYPWGESYAGCNQADVGGCARGTVPVGTRSANASPFGALDMAGNVWEWVSDGWNDSPATVGGTTDPHLPGSKTLGVLRGGSWDFSAPYARAFSRLKFSATSGHVSTGVRCAKDGAE